MMRFFSGIMLPALILLLIDSNVMTDSANLQVFNSNNVKIANIEILENQGTKYVPLSSVASLFYGTARMEPLLKRVTVTIKDRKIILNLEKTYLRIDDDEYVISNPPLAISGKIAVPLEFLTEIVPVITGKKNILDREKWTLVLSDKALDDESGEIQKPKDTVQPDLGSVRIILDPGHGGYDMGCKSKTGIQEKEITLLLAQRMKEILDQEQGISVFLTRNSDSYLSLEDRASFVNKLRGDIFLSIHFNWSFAKNATGFELYVNSNRINVAYSSGVGEAVNKFRIESNDKSLQQSKQLAKEIATRLENIGLTGRYGLEASLAMMDGISVPALMMELLYLSNQSDITFISKPESVDLLARTLCDSLLVFRSTVGISSQR